MPLTSAEKIRRFREKKKLTDPDYQKKENMRTEAIRKKKVAGMTALQKKQYKAAAKLVTWHHPHTTGHSFVQDYGAH